jgi:hypothetical protein
MELSLHVSKLILKLRIFPFRLFFWGGGARAMYGWWLVVVVGIVSWKWEFALILCSYPVFLTKSCKSAFWVS